MLCSKAANWVAKGFPIPASEATDHDRVVCVTPEDGITVANLSPKLRIWDSRLAAGSEPKATDHWNV